MHTFEACRSGLDLREHRRSMPPRTGCGRVQLEHYVVEDQVLARVAEHATGEEGSTGRRGGRPIGDEGTPPCLLWRNSPPRVKAEDTTEKRESERARDG